jgi:glycosyltransferase involved in cell wall biosynthesis
MPIAAGSKDISTTPQERKGLYNDMASLTFLQPHLRFGGAERQTVLVANRLVATGHECTVILHSDEGGLSDQLDARVNLRTIGTANHLAVPFTALRLRRELASMDPTFIVVKLWSSILAASLVDRAISKHAYNYCEDLDPTDHARYIRFGRVKQKLIRRIFRSRSLLTANTKTVAKTMVEVYGLTTQPAIVPSTVDVALTRRLAAEDPRTFEQDAELNILSVGSLIERKGLRTTLEALEMTGKRINWHVVGVGPLHEMLRAYNDARGLLKITVHGGTSNPYGYMAAADLLVHSAPSEAFGIVIVESLAVGTPVIAADAIGPTEMLERLGDEPDKFRLYPRMDASALAGTINSWIDESFSSSVDAQDYLQPYSLDTAVAGWLEREAAWRLTR